MNNIVRLQESKLTNALASKGGREVILVQGARQVGKTTMVERVLQSVETVYALNL